MAEAPEAAKPPPPPQRPSVSLDDERDPDGPKVGPAGRKRVGILSTAISRAIVISAVLLCSVWLFLDLMSQDRYRIVPVSNTNAISVYRIDQLTGDVHLCTPQGCTQVPIRGMQAATGSAD